MRILESSDMDREAVRINAEVLDGDGRIVALMDQLVDRQGDRKGAFRRSIPDRRPPLVRYRWRLRWQGLEERHQKRTLPDHQNTFPGNQVAAPVVPLGAAVQRHRIVSFFLPAPLPWPTATASTPRPTLIRPIWRTSHRTRTKGAENKPPSASRPGGGSAVSRDEAIVTTGYWESRQVVVLP